jgi:hypothetical protein
MPSLLPTVHSLFIHFQDSIALLRPLRIFSRHAPISLGPDLPLALHIFVGAFFRKITLTVFLVKARSQRFIEAQTTSLGMHTTPLFHGPIRSDE